MNNQEALNRINSWCNHFPKTKLERQRLDEAFKTLQELIDDYSKTLDIKNEDDKNKYIIRLENSYKEHIKKIEELEKAMNEFKEYKKYIPNLEELYKWCKGDYLQAEGEKLKSQTLKESEKDEVSNK